VNKTTKKILIDYALFFSGALIMVVTIYLMFFVDHQTIIEWWYE